VERKLTAILCADVLGYSRLMGENEEVTLGTLSAHRKLIDSLIEQHHGRFVNSAGDSVLAELSSVVNAVECAVEIQSTLKAENASLSPERRMVLTGYAATGGGFNNSAPYGRVGLSRAMGTVSGSPTQPAAPVVDESRARGQRLP
jgi:class 3 adenylate cyclase